jgi:hypothetical protein
VPSRVGTPSTFTLVAESVTTSCRCQNTTGSQWSCSSAKHCTSEYDNGGPNPDVCQVVDSVPVTLGEVKVVVDRADCTAVVVARSTSESDVTLTCTEAGPVDVYVTTAETDFYSEHFLLFTPNGSCPPEDDAGSEADAGADADSDAGGQADAEADAER